MSKLNMSKTVPHKERGAVLLTTLLLLTVMAAITVAIMDDILFSVRRTTNIEAAEQMDWYSRGGEEYAKTWIFNAASGDPAGLNLVIINREPLTLPIDEGAFRLLIEDGRNCFNLNQLAGEEQVKANKERLEFLLTMLDFPGPEAISIAAHIQDWIDSDVSPLPSGAEEFAYLNKTPPYHPANTPMVDITELRSIEGIDEDIFERISPFLCARNNKENNIININSLRIDQAPLLAEVFGVDNALSAAQSVIEERPLGGYESIDKVWESPSIEALELKGAGKDKVALETDRIIVNLQVEFRGQERTRAILYGLGQGETTGGVSLIARRGMF